MLLELPWFILYRKLTCCLPSTSIWHRRPEWGTMAVSEVRQWWQ